MDSGRERREGVRPVPMMCTIDLTFDVACAVFVERRLTVFCMDCLNDSFGSSLEMS